VSSYSDIEYLNATGLRLYARDYSHPAPHATVLCLPGTTANSADFAEVGFLTDL
jgi:hypothetical protein